MVFIPKEIFRMIMRYKLSVFFFCIAAMTTAFVNAENNCINSRVDSHSQLTFEKADASMGEYLTSFAVESNDIYQTRTANIEVAREIFHIPLECFEKGFVEILKLEGEIIGFYSLKEHPPYGEGFEQELGLLL